MRRIALFSSLVLAATAASGVQAQSIDYIPNTQSYSQLINGKVYVASNYSKCADMSDARNVWKKYWCLKPVGALSAAQVAKLTAAPAPAPTPVAPKPTPASPAPTPAPSGLQIDFISNTQSYSQLINGKTYVASNYSKCADLSDARNVWNKYWCLKSVGSLSASKVAQLTAAPAPGPTPAPTPVAPKPAPAPTPVAPAPTPAPSGLQIDFISNTQSYSQLINGKTYVASNYSKCADLSDARNVWHKYWCLRDVGSLSADKVAQLTSGMPSAPAPTPAPGNGNAGGDTGQVPVTYTAKLNWTPPSTREDGAPLKMSEIRGYEIYYTSDDLKTSITVPLNSGSATSHAVNNLKAGTYHFAISAIDSNGLKSELSQMVSTKVGS